MSLIFAIFEWFGIQIFYKGCPPTTFRLSRCGNSLVSLSFWQQCGYFTLYRIITSVERTYFTKIYWHTSFQGMKSCTGAAFQICMYTMLSGTDRVGCSERHDAVITSVSSCNWMYSVYIYKLFIFATLKHNHFIHQNVHIPHLRQECHNSKFGIFQLLV